MVYTSDGEEPDDEKRRAAMMAKKIAKTASKSGVHLEESRYGTPQPTYYLVRSAVARMSHREVNASLYELAARIESATEERGKATETRETWIVQIDKERACVYLELGDGCPNEAARGMATLEEVQRA